MLPQAILANIFLFSIFFVMISVTKYEKLGKYFPCCTRHCAITTKNNSLKTDILFTIVKNGAPLPHLNRYPDNRTRPRYSVGRRFSEKKIENFRRRI